MRSSAPSAASASIEAWRRCAVAIKDAKLMGYLDGRCADASLRLDVRRADYVGPFVHLDFQLGGEFLRVSAGGFEAERHHPLPDVRQSDDGPGRCVKQFDDFPRAAGRKEDADPSVSFQVRM